jgi:hypothetical protein
LRADGTKGKSEMKKDQRGINTASKPSGSGWRVCRTALNSSSRRNTAHWLNLIESFFGKLARTLLRGIRVSSKAELKARIELYLKKMNEEPVVSKWKHKLATLATESVVT